MVQIVLPIRIYRAEDILLANLSFGEKIIKDRGTELKKQTIFRCGGRLVEETLLWLWAIGA